ncbi:MAG: hypothetical protein GQ574_18565 [Crocinitomix sp.]|nr:hypothetical protein [Crocinitomix sp.]
MKTLRHVSSVLLATDKQKLWDVMTQGDWTEKYMFSCRLISNYTIGSNVDWKGSFDGQDYFLTGILLEIEPLKLFKYTLIDPEQFDASEPNNFVIITYEIKEQGDKLLLTVVNETNDGNAERMKEIVGGWEGMIFPAIEALL